MNLLVTGAWGQAKAHIPELKAMGHEVVFLQQEKDALPVEPAWVEGVICNGLFLSHPIESFPNLRFIQLTSAGYDRVDMDYIAAHNIEIHNARGVYSIPMAEFALWGVLDVYKGGRGFAESRKAHAWVKQRNLRELKGKTVTIIGCGDVGTECARRFRAFGCRIWGVDRVVKDTPEYDRTVLTAQMDELLPETDVLLLTVALTPETRHMIGKRQFEQMKNDAVLVNISRGAVVDTDALLDWLNRNPAAHAVLDVFEEEPLDPVSPLWDMENVLATPHNSFVGDGNEGRLWEKIFSTGD